MAGIKWVKVIEDPKPEDEDDEQRLIYSTTDDRFVLSRGGCDESQYPWMLYYVPSGERRRIANQLGEGRNEVRGDWLLGHWYAYANPPLKQVETHIMELLDRELDRLTVAKR